MFIGISSGRYDAIPPDQMFVVDTDDFVIESERISVLNASNIEIIRDTVQSNLIRGYRGIKVRLSGSPKFQMPGQPEVGLSLSLICATDYVMQKIFLVIDGQRYRIGTLQYKSTDPNQDSQFNVVSFERLGRYLIYTVRFSYKDNESRVFLVLRFVWNEIGQFVGFYLLDKALIIDDLWIFTETVKPTVRIKDGCILDKAIQAKIELLKEGY